MADRRSSIANCRAFRTRRQSAMVGSAKSNMTGAQEHEVVESRARPRVGWRRCGGFSLAEQKRKLVAILAADAAGYSRLMAADEADTLARLRQLRTQIMEPAIARLGGRIVGPAGDSLLVEFASALSAVECAVEIQGQLADANAELLADTRMEFRIGINVGDVIAEDETIYGDGVNVAARIERLAEPGAVCISRSVYDQVRGKLRPHGGPASGARRGGPDCGPRSQSKFRPGSYDPGVHPRLWRKVGRGARSHRCRYAPVAARFNPGGKSLDDRHVPFYGWPIERSGRVSAPRSAAQTGFWNCVAQPRVRVRTKRRPRSRPGGAGRALRLQPNLSLDWIERFHPIVLPEHRALYAEGLRRAGLS
jgi:class 3 adenylate cyclase